MFLLRTGKGPRKSKKQIKSLKTLMGKITGADSTQGKQVGNLQLSQLKTVTGKQKLRSRDVTQSQRTQGCLVTQKSTRSGGRGQVR